MSGLIEHGGAVSPLNVLCKPEKLDVIWRPVARVLLVGTGLIGSGALWWMAEWLWLPFPLIAAFLVYELIFWIRGDRPVQITVDDDALTMHDVLRDQRVHVPIGDVRAASIAFRAGKDPKLTLAWLVLHGERGALFAVRFETGFDAWTDEHTDLAALSPVLGGNAGVLRALAGRDRSCRQVIVDRRGNVLKYLLDWLPDHVWQTTAVRVWRGEQPTLDYLGLHEGVNDGVLLFKGTTFELFMDGQVRSGDLSELKAGRSLRQITLMHLPGEPTSTSDLPVLVLDLDAHVQLALPAPLAGFLGDPVPLTELSLHTHLAEAAHVVWHLLAHLRPTSLPASIKLAVQESRAASSYPVAVLRRHL
ncbi:MAG: hypothetical protein ACI9MC_004125 [Kiritimatiellia bacterium]|jgi:hypothetical protein